jgi:hypothetical protein
MAAQSYPLFIVDDSLPLPTITEDSQPFSTHPLQLTKNGSVRSKFQFVDLDPGEYVASVLAY